MVAKFDFLVLLRRSVMNKVSVLQVRTGLESQHGKPTTVIKKFVKTRYTGGRTTLPGEEMVGTARNYKEAKKCRKHRRPETRALLYK